MAHTQDLENEAERLVRRAAADRLPVDAGIIAMVSRLIREACDRGQLEIRQLAEAELSELARMQGEPDPDEVQSVRDFLKRLETYGA